MVDVQVSKVDAPDPVVAGSGTGNLTHTVTVHNFGPSDASGIALSEAVTLPLGTSIAQITASTGSYAPANDPNGTWTLGDLAAGDSAKLTVVMTVGPSTAHGATVSNTATITAVTEPDPDDDSSPNTASATTTVRREVDLRVSKVDDVDPVVAGSGAGNLTHTVTVANDGPSDASGISLSEAVTLPSGTSIVSITPSAGTYPGTSSNGTWALGLLAAGASETLTVTMTVGALTLVGTDVISNTASVSAVNETDTDNTNNSATESTSVTCPFTIINTTDSGCGSLRYAINQANGTGGAETLSFDISGGGPHIITPGSALPTITEPLIIDGASEPDDAGVCSNPIATRPPYVVILDGGGGSFAGLTFGAGSDGSTVQGMNIRNFDGIGININGSSGNTVECNFIGTDEDGNTDSGNTSHGVQITGASTNNTIGTDSNASNDANEGNLISGNDGQGVHITGSGATGNAVAGNYIGTDAAGTTTLANALNGVLIGGDASTNMIGGTLASASNTIAFNTQDGAVIDGDASTANSIRSNSIFENGQLGIDLGDDGPTANDPGDLDASPNKLQNFPEITLAEVSGGNLMVTYLVDSAPANQTYPLTVEFFLADVDGEEGQTLVGSDTYTAADFATGVKTINLGSVTGSAMVATATDGDGNTSEFSVSAPALAASKSDAVVGGAPAMPGATIRYTVTLTNPGTAPATNVVFTDTPDANTTLAAASGTVSGATGATFDYTGGVFTATLDAPLPGLGGTVMITFDVIINDPVPAGVDQVCNQGTATADDGLSEVTGDPDETGSGDPDDETCTGVDAMPDVVAQKTDTFLDDGNTDGLANPGETIQYSVTITNNGNEDGTGVVFTDLASDHPNTTLVATSVTTTGGTVTTGNTAGDTDVVVNVGALPGGGSVEITFEVMIDAVLPTAVVEVCNQGVVTDNFPAVSTDDPDDGTSLSDATCLAVEAAPDLSLTKDDGGALVMPGEVIVYTLGYVNGGDQDATGVEITETVPDNTTFNAGASTPGWVCTPDGSACNTCTFAVAGEVAGGGDTGSVMFAVLVDPSIPADVIEITNTASVADDGANGPDPNTANNTATDTTPITAETEVVVAKLDEIILDTVGSPGADPGDRIKYTVTITNEGGREATGVVFTDTVDPNTSLDCASISATPMASLTSCTPGPGGTLTIDVGALAGNGGTITIMFEVEIVSPFPQEVFEVSNQGAVSGDNFADAQTDDPDTAAAGDATHTAINEADLEITKTLIDTSEGNDGTYEATFAIMVTNNGPNDASGVFVSDPLPEGTMLVSQSGGYDSQTGLWTIGELASGASASLTITLKTDDGDNDLVNIAEVFADQPDEDTGNNLSGSQARHDAADPDRFRADLSLTKTVDNETPAPGDLVTYTLEVNNDGPSTTSGVAVLERLPDGLEFVSATASNTSSSCPACGYNDSLGVWIVGHVPVGTTVSLELVARVVGTGQITNTAEIVESHLPDPNAEDDGSSAMIDVASGKATATVRSGAEGIPTAFEISGNYPNPFNPETVIPFGLPQAAHVVLEVYDLLGKRVAVLLDEELSAGRHEVMWYAIDEPSGMYLVRLLAGKVQKTQRVTLVK